MNLKLRTALSLGLIGMAGAAAAAPIAAVTDDNRIFFADSASPQITPVVASITGLQTGETILGIDTRPANGQLYAVGSTGRIYRIGNGVGGTVLGGVQQVGPGPAFTPTAGASYDIDFNPTVDRIRVVADDDSNLRLHPDTGLLVATDTALTPTGDTTGAAYDRNFAGATVTNLFVIDSTSNRMLRQGGVDGTPSPNGGVLTDIGPLGVDPTSAVGFDISSTGEGIASFNVGGARGLYRINVASGTAGFGSASFINPFPAGANVTDVTFVPFVPNLNAGATIPTLSPATLALLAGAFGLLGFVVLRRKG